MTTSLPGLNPAVLARQVLECYLENGNMPQLPDPLPPEYGMRSGVFVSLKKRGGVLRGCIGTFEPVRNNLAEEIAVNAVSAAVRDPRFPPVSKAELSELNISVDILGPIEKVNSKDELDPGKYGIMVRSGSRSGLLLPDLEGVDSVDQQIDISKRKAGIGPGEKVELFRFKVTRYGEEER